MSSPASRTVISVSAEVPMMEERLNSMEAKLAKLDQLETAVGEIKATLSQLLRYHETR